MCFALIGPLDVLGGGEGGEDELPYVDHGRRTDEGRDKNVCYLWLSYEFGSDFHMFCLLGLIYGT